MQITKKKVGGGAVAIAASVLAILNANPEDPRLPDEAIVAVYPEEKHGGDGYDAFYGAEFAEVRDTVGARGPATFYAIPRKEALEPIALGTRYPWTELTPDTMWRISWSRQKVIEEGEPLDPREDYPGRFTLKDL